MGGASRRRITAKGAPAANGRRAASGGKRVYFFGPDRAEGSGAMRDRLGGKGAGLSEMVNAGLPVPPGFTITTDVCRLYSESGGRVPRDVQAECDAALARLERTMGRTLGDPTDPLLVSVRSGAKFSMPGMMDTILNLGLNDRSVRGLAARTSNPRFAFDAYRRFLQMFGNVVLGIGKERFEERLVARKQLRGVATDQELSAEDLEDLVVEFQEVVRRVARREFPQDPRVQLGEARDAVFRSWNNERAVFYRRQNRISDDLGTAVNVQSMVFGNMGADSATGVGFTRDPATGEKQFFGEYLTNAQGEDVVAGVRTPKPINELAVEMPGVYDQLRRITQKLERHARDVQDFEFTVERGTLYMLQTRNGQRTGMAALRFAVDMVAERLITRNQALLRVDADKHIPQVLAPVFEAEAKRAAVDAGRAVARGLPAGPGAASGTLVLTRDGVPEAARRGPVVFVRAETNPDDLEAMVAAHRSRGGILTARGGMTSHAAVVARGMGIPAVVGCGALVVDEVARTVQANGLTLREGDAVSIDGFSGELFLGALPTVPSEVRRVLDGSLRAADSPVHRAYDALLGWADRVRRLRVRANADVPEDARAAVRFGAEGIGLCRTEHMFFEPARLPIVQKMILYSAEAKTVEARLQREVRERLRTASEAAVAEELERELKKTEPVRKYREALSELLPFQRADFEGLFQEMAGRPVTIRTLDPPLHEFIPKNREEAAALAAKLGVESERMWQRARELHEFNPMLGQRGCRLGISYPEVTQMQARAIFEAACACAARGVRVQPEIMVPLVGNVNELREQKRIIVATAEAVFAEQSRRVPYLVGTMIEVPRAALTADEIAREADFFSFGTNDLTQMTLGLSRDDTGPVIREYIDRKILPADPFATLDTRGVGAIMRIGLERGRMTRKDLKVGICGEHGGDPASIEFCHWIGMDYVSCSPYRVPVARLAAAQAVLRERDADRGGGAA